MVKLKAGLTIASIGTLLALFTPASDAASCVSQPNPAAPCPSSITIVVSPTAGTWGVTFHVSGTLSCDAFTQGQVSFAKALPGRSFASVTTANVGPDGAFSFDDKPATNATYKVSYGGSALCAAATSNAVPVLTRAGVAINPSSTRPKAGAPVMFAGKVAPPKPGKKVVLQVYRQGAWRNAATTTLDSSSTYRAAYRKETRGSLMFRVLYWTQDSLNGWNSSRNVGILWE